MPNTFAPSSEQAIPLHVLECSAVEAFVSRQDDSVASWVTSNGFTGAQGQALLIPGPDARPIMALAGYGTATQRNRNRFVLSAAVSNLPEGIFEIASGLADEDLIAECYGWLINSYTFDRYKPQSGSKAQLVAPPGVDTARAEAMVSAECLVRDLINTPASDMGPEELAAAAQSLATEHGADIDIVTGDDLLNQNFPMIHAVGRASPRAPRLIDMRWGSSGPKLTLVGKGVCFDTGGLNLKPGASMGLMKKDMGGAANVLGLAHMIMSLNLPVRLRVLIPAVENSVSGNAIRPGDILTSRKGLTVEINNTDAEGRLVLADALTLADEDNPDLLISMATLTGAARVAVGPDLAPYFTDDETASTALMSAAGRVADPMWRLPFHDAYETMVEPALADLDNAPSGGFAGAITAALFLRRFAGDSRYIHFDVYGWTSNPGPARPKGGVGQGPRAILEALPEILKL
ncbi:leucyl aminopeptidase family protein [Aliisedimentitalea scapharcae]|uniref:Leucyl aminopeptidase family protein n=1 Tax=Aliisedimentitalea scapharcae TaxID=1524259 RepID=A0ABZ2Y0A4_9RHOB